MQIGTVWGDSILRERFGTGGRPYTAAEAAPWHCCDCSRHQRDCWSGDITPYLIIALDADEAERLALTDVQHSFYMVPGGYNCCGDDDGSYRFYCHPDAYCFRLYCCCHACPAKSTRVL